MRKPGIVVVAVTLFMAFGVPSLTGPFRDAISTAEPSEERTCTTVVLDVKAAYPPRPGRPAVDVCDATW
jgi:hypothetical protein